MIVHARGNDGAVGFGRLAARIMSDAEFREGRTQWHPGDVLVILFGRCF